MKTSLRNAINSLVNQLKKEAEEDSISFFAEANTKMKIIKLLEDILKKH